MTGSPHEEEDARWFRRAAMAAGHAIVVTGPEVERPGPVIRFVNAAMCALTGYAEHELLGATPYGKTFVTVRPSATRPVSA